MKHRRNKAWLFGAVFLLSLMLMGRDNSAAAAERKGSITVDYHVTMEQGGESHPTGIPFTVYPLGVIQDGAVLLNDAFRPSGVSMADTTASGRNRQAKELYAYALEHGVSGTTAETKDGVVKLEGLDVGVYLVVQTKSYQTDAGKAESDPFLISLPLDMDGTWMYDVRVEPKALWTPIAQPMSPTPNRPTVPETEQPIKLPTESPKTGDDARLLLWLSGAVASGVGLVLLPQRRKA